MNAFEFPSNVEPPPNFSVFHSNAGKLIVLGAVIEMSLQDFLGLGTDEELEGLAGRTGVDFWHLFVARFMLQLAFDVGEGFGAEHGRSNPLEQVYGQHEFWGLG